jgi:uncharacterized membrane protein HdeD (DUF308 family)
MSGQRHVGPRNPDGGHAREGLWLGPLHVTPTRVLVVVALVGSVGYFAYAVTVREESQIPMLAAGATVLGIVFAALAIAGAISTLRAARADRPGWSVVNAILGGIAGVIAFGCFAGAAVLALLWRG